MPGDGAAEETFCFLPMKRNFVLMLVSGTQLYLFGNLKASSLH